MVAMRYSTPCAKPVEAEPAYALNAFRYGKSGRMIEAQRSFGRIDSK